MIEKQLKFCRWSDPKLRYIQNHNVTVELLERIVGTFTFTEWYALPSELRAFFRGENDRTLKKWDEV